MTILRLSSPVAVGPGTSNWQLKPEGYPEGYFGHGLGHRVLIRTPAGYRAQPLKKKNDDNGFREFDLTPSALVEKNGSLSLNTAPEADELILLITLRSPYGAYHLRTNHAEVLLRRPLQASLTCHLAVRLTHPDGSLVAQSGNTAEIYNWQGRQVIPIHSLGMHLSDVVEDNRAASQLTIAKQLRYMRDFAASITA